MSQSLFLKWPNDIVTESKKLGGLLMEITQINQQKFLVLGIGINVNQLDWQNQPKATSLAIIQGHAFDRDEVMDAIFFLWTIFGKTGRICRLTIVNRFGRWVSK